MPELLTASHSSCLKYLRSMYNSGELSDLTLKLDDGKQLKVHKFVVFTCPFIKAACTSGFKELTENVIEFPEDPPAALEKVIMILYGFRWKFYAGEAPSDYLQCTENDSWTPTHLPEAYELAKKYMVPEAAECILKLAKISLHIEDECGILSWYWGLARYFETHEEHAPEMYANLLVALRNNADEMVGESEFVQKQLQRCSKFAAKIAATGGLDGKGLTL